MPERREIEFSLGAVADALAVAVGGQTAPRQSGWHLTSILRAADEVANAKDVNPADYYEYHDGSGTDSSDDKFDATTLGMFAMGRLWEEASRPAFAEWCRARGEQAHPPEQRELDGIHANADGFVANADGYLVAIQESKFRFTHVDTDPLKQERWLRQVKGYCKIWGVNKVYFVVGNIRQRPPSAAARIYEITFDWEEIESNWRLISEVKEYLAHGCQTQPPAVVQETMAQARLTPVGFLPDAAPLYESAPHASLIPVGEDPSDFMGTSLWCVDDTLCTPGCQWTQINSDGETLSNCLRLQGMAFAATAQQAVAPEPAGVVEVVEVAEAVEAVEATQTCIHYPMMRCANTTGCMSVPNEAGQVVGVCAREYGELGPDELEAATVPEAIPEPTVCLRHPQQLCSDFDPGCDVVRDPNGQLLLVCLRQGAGAPDPEPAMLGEVQQDITHEGPMELVAPNSPETLWDTLAPPEAPSLDMEANQEMVASAQLHLHVFMPLDADKPPQLCAMAARTFDDAEHPATRAAVVCDCGIAICRECAPKLMGGEIALESS